MPDDLCYLTAEAALAAFAARTLSPVELMEAVLARAEAVEPLVNALPLRYPEAALEAAREAERRWQEGTARALEGLPLAIKDSTALAGQPTSMGSLLADEASSRTTTILNRRLLEAGAIPHARATTPEFSCAYYAHSRKWGVTRNPWDAAHSPGGSSGGSAAALASGTATLATGSDIAGSIRQPAALCGLVGYKAPHGRVPMEPPFGLDPYCHAAGMARSVGDMARMQAVIAGPDPHDPLSLPDPPALPDHPADLKGWRIAYSPDLGAYHVAPDVAAAVARAVALFADLGAEIEEVRLPWTQAHLHAGLAHLHLGFATWIARHSEGRDDALSDYTRRFAEAGRAVPASAHLESLEAVGAMNAALVPVFARCRLLLAPTTAIAGLPAGYDAARDTLRAGAHEIDEWHSAMTLPFNMLSRHPVMSVPAGRVGRLPVGLQIVGHPLAEWDVFGAALAYEAAAGGWYRTADARPHLRQ